MMQQDAQGPLDDVQPDGGAVDVWLMDDQTISCDNDWCVRPFDAVGEDCQGPARGGVRNRTKTHAIIYANDQQ